MHLLLDFDGTLVDSFDCVMQKAILLAEEFSLRKIEEQEIESLRDLSSTEIISFLKVPFYKIPSLISRMRQHLHQEIPNLLPVAGMPSVLETCFNEKFTLGIVTSNSVENVEAWLDINHMRHLISFIHSESNYFSKSSLIKKILVKNQINKLQAAYIGDETRDIDAAKKNKISSVAVTWGYNSEKALLKSEPSYLAKIPADILKLYHL